MTQTTPVNDFTATTTTDMLHAVVPKLYHQHLRRVLARAARPEILAEFIHDLHGTFDWDTIGIALRDLEAVQAPASPRAIRKFCEGVASQATKQTPGTNGRKPRLDLDAVRSRLTSDKEVANA